MAILKCKMCGGDIELSQDKTFGTCEFCGSTMTFPKVDDEQRAAAFNRGNHFRRIGEFDKALAVYERIVQEDENDAEAHWCCALCRFGIEYVEDPNTFEYLPTCHRASFDSFLEDVDYLAALEHSDGITRRQYQKDAAKIAEVQRGILATSQNEEPFDVFICYKESEEDGRRTRDSLYAQDIYYQLTEQGRRVFFSRITLEDKAGTEYEPYIFAALNSAKVMILVTTSAEHANAVWVKNEWSRFLSLMRKDRTKLLLPCYRDMDPYDLPEALSVLQSYDMSKIGFIQDLIRGVNKVLEGAKPKQAAKETVVVQQQSSHAAPLLERAFMFLEDGDWAKADEFCEQVLNLEPKNAQAYLGKLMAELKVRKREQLKDQPQPFDDRSNYQKALRFGDGKLKAELAGIITFINDRNETARKESIYQKALLWMKDEKYTDAQDLFDSISDYRDADAKSKICTQKAEEARKNNIYSQAAVQMSKNTVPTYESAINTFRTIPGWKDSDDQILACQRRIEEIKAKEEADRLERERKAYEERIAEEKRKRKNRVTALVLALLALLGFGAYSLWTKVIQPNRQYQAAVALYDAGQYEEAISAFEAINGYKDSSMQIKACQIAIKDQAYSAAMALYDAGKYEEAITAFESLNDYKDSEAQIEACQIAIKDQAYFAAMVLYDAGKYEEAITAFESLNGYKNSEVQINICQTAIKDQDYDLAVSLFEMGQYEEAIVAFKTLNGYKDSEAQIETCQTAIKDTEYDTAVALLEAGKYEEAIAAFESLNGYKDSAVQIEACQTAIKDADYSAAIEFAKTEDYEKAFYAFTALNGYKDSEEKIVEIKPKYYKWLLSNAKEGSTIYFGRYEQDNDISNGKEDVEWIVLAVENNRILVISKYALDYNRYDTFYTSVTWETCALRKWLNGSFLNTTFSAEEINRIANATVTADKNPLFSTTPGMNTKDKVFLLSITEVNKYLVTESARQCISTDFFKAQAKYKGKTPWWLRSPGGDSNYAIVISGDGLINYYGESASHFYCAVRPALWIEIS